MAEVAVATAATAVGVPKHVEKIKSAGFGSYGKALGTYHVVELQRNQLPRL